MLLPNKAHQKYHGFVKLFFFQERKRRDHIKDSFSKLRDAIPSMTGDKLSR